MWDLLEAGARVYVRGDGSRMAPGVRAAFLALHGERARGDSRQWLDSLVAEGRYVEDVHPAG